MGGRWEDGKSPSLLLSLPRTGGEGQVVLLPPIPSTEELLGGGKTGCLTHSFLLFKGLRRWEDG